MSINKTMTTAAAMMMTCSLATERIAAQTPTSAPTAAAARSAEPQPLSRDFLALDLVAGGMGSGNTQTSDDDSSGFGATGWEVGGTVRFRPWLGVSSTFARTSAETGERMYHYLVGPRVNTDIGGQYGSRAFAHVLVGATSANGTPVSRGGYELVVGAGFDTFAVTRLQIDYIRSRTGGEYTNGARAFFGAVIPLCFRGCRPHGADGFTIR